jgi:hypothetical protein
MHGRVARYSYEGDPQELGRRAEEGVLPLFQSQPGFKGYSILDIGGEIISFSAWDSGAAADAANATAATWVADNMGDELHLKEVHVGQILFSTTLGVTTKTGVTA